MDSGQLSGNIQLLHFLYRPRATGPDLSRHFSKRDDIDIKLLDSIALYLINNTPGDFVAVALDTSSSFIRFVLARNTTPSTQDILLADEFFSTIVSMEPAIDLLKITFKFDYDTLWTKIYNCCVIDMDVVDHFLQEYVLGDASEEFKKVPAILFVLTKAWETTDSRTLLRRAFIEMIGLIHELSRPKVTITKSSLSELSKCVVFIFFRKFFSHPADTDESEDLYAVQMTEYKRRIYQVARYQISAAAR